MDHEKIVIKGAREHNLKNIDLDIPRNKLVVITGVSGSGKSSLAFDTIYAEGQRRYVESLSAYARQFLELMEKPDLDYIDGLSPAISIEQKTISKNPRSTVGTVTEIYDYLRLLFARVGEPYCWICGQLIAPQSTQQMADRIVSLPAGEKIMLMAPVIRGRKGEYRKLIQDLRKKGYVRVFVDGKIRLTDEDIPLARNVKHDIFVIIDRIIVRPDIGGRLSESIETALSLSDGLVVIRREDGEEMILSEKMACPKCGVSVQEMTPRLFSFNSPYGACQACDGLGNIMNFDPDLVVPDKELSLREGAVSPWEKRNSVLFFETLKSLADRYHFSLRQPFGELPEEVQSVILYGSGREKIKFTFQSERGRYTVHRPFEGVISNLKRRYRETASAYVRKEIQRYMSIHPCETCSGQRLRAESLSVRIEGKNIAEYCSMSVQEARGAFLGLRLTDRKMDIAGPILKEINERLSFLEDVGLDYLTLDRSSATLAGGEGQRIRLATQIGSRLVGVLYVLDEPSIGLHQRDTHRLLETLKGLRDLGNTVLVVEHDEGTILASDYVIDLGPGAGRHGGKVVAVGTPGEITAHPKSLTGMYLRGEKFIPLPDKRKVPGGKHLIIRGAIQNNLRNIDLKIPLEVFICVTGVSGSGKSTMIMDILYRALARHFYHSQVKPGRHAGLDGIENIDKVVDINQAPIGRTPRSNPATYTGVFNPIRELFSAVPEARARGYKPGRFSFNVKGGRCEACQGDGIIKIEMHFLPDVYVSCDVCKGKRYNRDTLEIEYRGKNISDVLNMTVREALDFFERVPSIRHKLMTINDVGLGYIKLGQPATQLSGGEAQRVKLSKELSRKSTGKTLYILDEPTTGLHFDDIKKLLEMLNRLVRANNTVIVIEHNLEVIKSADYIIDLGPEGGEKGGRIIAEGPPEVIIKNSRSHTGRYLKEVLKREKSQNAAVK